MKRSKSTIRRYQFSPKLSSSTEGDAYMVQTKCQSPITFREPTSKAVKVVINTKTHGNIEKLLVGSFEERTIASNKNKTSIDGAVFTYATVAARTPTNRGLA